MILYSVSLTSRAFEMGLETVFKFLKGKVMTGLDATATKKYYF